MIDAAAILKGCEREELFRVFVDFKSKWAKVADGFIQVFQDLSGREELLDLGYPINLDETLNDKVMAVKFNKKDKVVSLHVNPFLLLEMLKAMDFEKDHCRIDIYQAESKDRHLAGGYVFCVASQKTAGNLMSLRNDAGDDGLFVPYEKDDEAKAE